MFTCKKCPRNFTTDSSRGLTLHQRKCSAYIRQTQDFVNILRRLASHKLKQTSALNARKLRIQDVDDTVGDKEKRNDVAVIFSGYSLIYQQVAVASTSNEQFDQRSDSNREILPPDFVHPALPMAPWPPTPPPPPPSPPVTPPCLTQSGRPQRNYLPHQYLFKFSIKRNH